MTAPEKPTPGQIGLVDGDKLVEWIQKQISILGVCSSEYSFGIQILGNLDRFRCVEEAIKSAAFKPATPAPTQPSEVGPYKTVPSISCPGFYTLQENRINIFGPAKLRECHDYMAFARKGFALGQSSARSQEGRLLKQALRWIPDGPEYGEAWNLRKRIDALTTTPEATEPELDYKAMWEKLKGAIESRIVLQDRNDETGAFIADEMNTCLGFMTALETAGPTEGWKS